jgi:hypothetical protein
MYIFILGLDHSRTTITDIALGQKIGAISLGEVRRTISPRGHELENRTYCSCGNSYEECEIWQKFTNGHLIESENTAIIDSSKEIKHYRLNLAKNDNVVTVLVLRKFSDWHASALASRVRNNRSTLRSVMADRQFVKSNLRLYLRRFVLIAYTEWLLTQFRFFFAIKGKSYVVTCSQDIERIAQGLGKFNTNASRHIVRGNRISQRDNIDLNNFDESGLLQNFIKYWLERKNG